jgi:DNA-binding LacI/PurR family transcriptional regulator
MLSLAQLRRPPSAVFARNDFTAIGAMRAAYTLGMRVPDDVAIAGFDNIPLAAFTTPPLTTVAQPIAEQGSTAARFLLERITATKPGTSKSISMECSLIIRGSTVAEG